MSKIEMESWEDLVMEEVASFDLAAEEDELFVFDGETYDELFFGKDDRDLHRWELDPASAEDYPDHRRVLVTGPAQRWRHFGH